MAGTPLDVPLAPGERLLLQQPVELISSLRFPPTPPRQEAGGPGRLGCAVGAVVVALAAVTGQLGLPGIHGRTGEGLPGSLAVSMAWAFDPAARHQLAVTDRRVLLLEETRVDPDAPVGWKPAMHLVEQFAVPRVQVRASRRRWLLNPTRLRLDFGDGSWLVLDPQGFFPSRRRTDRVVNVLSSA